jgi:hypothetical protein
MTMNTRLGAARDAFKADERKQDLTDRIRRRIKPAQCGSTDPRVRTIALWTVRASLSFVVEEYRYFGRFNWKTYAEEAGLGYWPRFVALDSARFS